MVWNSVPFKTDDLPAIGHFFKKHYSSPRTYGTMDLFHWGIIDNHVSIGIINLVTISDSDNI